MAPFRGISNYHSVDAGCPYSIGDPTDLFFRVFVRGDFDHYSWWAGAVAGACGLDYACEDVGERFGALEGTEARGVGA